MLLRPVLASTRFWHASPVSFRVSSGQVSFKLIMLPTSHVKHLPTWNRHTKDFHSTKGCSCWSSGFRPRGCSPHLPFQRSHIIPPMFQSRLLALRNTQPHMPNSCSPFDLTPSEHTKNHCIMRVRARKKKCSGERRRLLVESETNPGP